MRLPVDKIPEDGFELLLTGDESFLRDSRDRLMVEDHLIIDPSIQGLVRLERGAGDIRLTGRIRGRIELQCARCLADFGDEVEVELDFLLQKSKENETLDALESAESSEPTIRFVGDEIDLDEIIIQEMLLSVPMKPLCREDCPGLCPRCGAISGSPECSCAEERPTDPRWTALERIKEKLKQ